MPLYEYQCDACGHRFETIQKFSDLPIQQCPKCGSTVRKLIASPAFQFKGSGWYVTDYAKKGAAPAPADKSAEGANAEAGGSAKEASKTESASASTGKEVSTGKEKSTGKPAETTSSKKKD